MRKGIKFRIYPNREQQNLINQTLGCCRLIYNKGLAMRKDGFAAGQKVGYVQTSAMLTDLKRQAAAKDILVGFQINATGLLYHTAMDSFGCVSFWRQICCP